MTFRIDLPLLGLAVKENQVVAVAIPAGQMVELIGPVGDDRFVVVSVNDGQFHVLASDLADRGIQIESAAKARGAA